MTIKTHDAELDGVRYIKERDILVAPPPPPITLQMILHVVHFQGNCVAWATAEKSHVLAVFAASYRF